MSHNLDANGYPVDEFGHDILSDEREDEQFLSLIDNATDEDLGFEDEDFDDDDDHQPTEYEEWQDVYGGDDWDHGQYDAFEFDSDLGNEY